MVYEKTDIILICAESRGISGGIRLLRVVMSELDEKVLPLLQVLLDPVSYAEGLHALGASAVLGIIRHNDIRVNM